MGRQGTCSCGRNKRTVSPWLEESKGRVTVVKKPRACHYGKKKTRGTLSDESKNMNWSRNQSWKTLTTERMNNLNEQWKDRRWTMSEWNVFKKITTLGMMVQLDCSEINYQQNAYWINMVMVTDIPFPLFFENFLKRFF